MQTAPNGHAAAMAQAIHARAHASKALLSGPSEESAFAALRETIFALRISHSAIADTPAYEAVKSLLHDSIFFAQAALGVWERRA
jgi:hypothetical protein